MLLLGPKKKGKCFSISESPNKIINIYANGHIFFTLLNVYTPSKSTQMFHMEQVSDRSTHVTDPETTYQAIITKGQRAFPQKIDG